MTLSSLGNNSCLWSNTPNIPSSPTPTHYITKPLLTGNWEKGGEDDVWGWNEFPPSGGQSNSLRLSTLWKRSWRKKINSRTRPNRNWNYIRGHRQYIPKDLNYICKIIHVTVLIFHVSIYDVHPKVIIWSESKLSQSSLFHLGVL